MNKQESPQLNFYATKAHPCSYLEEQEATTVFADPDFDMDPDVYSQLSEQGFRRSGKHIYRPHCQECSACQAIRLPVEQFKASRQQKRCWANNQDLSIEITDDIRSGEHYALYAKYIKERHKDGDMYPPSEEQYESFLTEQPYPVNADSSILAQEQSQEKTTTHYIELRQGAQLMGVAVTDILPVGLSAIYTFFEPEAQKRSLGVFSVLVQIELAKRFRLPHLYLGYWIKESPKMAYKSSYKPHEVFENGEWK